MSQTPRFTKPKVQQLPNDIVALVSACESLPNEHRQKIEPVLERVVDGIKRRRRILSLVQDALSQLRMDMKYLMFDLEATRRERDEYRERGWEDS